jgi:two-component system phosphate regulon sensor histidine kinase PhoR
MKLNNKIETEIFYIHEAVKNAVTIVKEIADKKTLDLRYYVDASLTNITNNKFSFEELLSSLLLNAVRYTRENGKIDLVIKDKNDRVLIEVADNGIGIPENELPLIFNEFYRATNAKAFKKHGTGLGLAIVKEIVTLYGGKIWVESKLDIGTSFFISFPKNISRI